MPRFAQLIRTFRPTILVVLGALIGAGVAPVMAGAHPNAQIAVTQTRAASCQGLNFHPVDKVTEFAYSGQELFRTNVDGSGYFLCDPALPNKAVVTKVQFTVNDDATYGQVQFCGLFRSGLKPATAATYDVVAQVPATGNNEEPKLVRLTATSIQNATVDNAQYAYWLQCQLTGVGDSIGIYGADVIYTITAANG